MIREEWFKIDCREGVDQYVPSLPHINIISTISKNSDMLFKNLYWYKNSWILRLPEFHGRKFLTTRSALPPCSVFGKGEKNRDPRWGGIPCDHFHSHLCGNGLYPGRCLAWRVFAYPAMFASMAACSCICFFVSTNGKLTIRRIACICVHICVCVCVMPVAGPILHNGNLGPNLQARICKLILAILSVTIGQ